MSGRRNYLTKYSQLIRQVLNNSRKKFIRLDEEVETLRLYIDLEKMRMKNFAYSIDIGEDVDTDFVEVPPLLLQPYVENAIWHGLMNKQEGDKRLYIKIQCIQDNIVISIEDNGIGRKQAAKLQSTTIGKKQSLGLQISQERLNLLNEIHGSDVRVEINDLHQPSGTRVVIYLPATD